MLGTGAGRKMFTSKLWDSKVLVTFLEKSLWRLKYEKTMKVKLYDNSNNYSLNEEASNKRNTAFSSNVADVKVDTRGLSRTLLKIYG